MIAHSRTIEVDVDRRAATRLQRAVSSGQPGQAGSGDTGRFRSGAEGDSKRGSDRREAEDYFFCDDFLDHRRAEEILAATPAAPAQSKPAPRPGELPAYFAHLYATPLLSKEQEQHLFRKYNYLKFLQSETRRDVGPTSTEELEEELEAIADATERTRNLIVEANLRLVVSLAKRYANDQHVEMDDMIGVGNATLIRAVELFDFRRGLCFSTYAYQAVARSMITALNRRQRRMRCFVPEGDELTEAAERDAASGTWDQCRAEEADESATFLMNELPPRDRFIVMSRFGIGREHEGASFSSIAKEVGLSTTRTVQLYNRSIEKMRRLAVSAGILESDSAA